MKRVFLTLMTAGLKKWLEKKVWNKIRLPLLPQHPKAVGFFILLVLKIQKLINYG